MSNSNSNSGDLHPEIPIPPSPAMIVIPDSGDDLPEREEKADYSDGEPEVEFLDPPRGERGKRKAKPKAKPKSKKAKVTKCLDIVIPEGCEDFRVFLSFGGYDWIAEWHDDGSVPVILPIFTKRGVHDAR